MIGASRKEQKKKSCDQVRALERPTCCNRSSMPSRSRYESRWLDDRPCQMNAYAIGRPRPGPRHCRVTAAPFQAWFLDRLFWHRLFKATRPAPVAQGEPGPSPSPCAHRPSGDLGPASAPPTGPPGGGWWGGFDRREAARLGGTVGGREAVGAS